MPQVVIENPIINSPFEEPQRHFRFDEQGVTTQIEFVEVRDPWDVKKEILGQKDG